MKFLLLGLLALSTPAFAAGDSCVDIVPPALRQLLQHRYPNERLPLVTDSSAENRHQAIQRGDTCLLVASADVNGDRRTDMILVLPSREGHRYRLVAALNQSTGWKLTSLGEWEGAYENQYVDVAPPGTYRQTEAYAFIPGSGAVEQIRTKRPGFFMGEIEAGSDAYFLDKDRWVHVHPID